MKNNNELMSAAKEALNGKWGIAVLAYIVIILINIPIQLVAETSQFSIIISLILGGPLTLGIAIFHLKIIRNQTPTIEDLFEGFRNIQTPVLTYLLMIAHIILWTLLFIIPGIIIAISYALTFYILADKPELQPMEALNESKRIMHGHKLQFFEIIIRIIALALLSVLTLGIGLLFLVPYSKVLIAKFYEEVKNQS